MSMQPQKNQIRQVISIPGMHCRSCEIMLTDEIEKLPGVTSVRASSKRKAVEITATTGDMPSDIEIAQAVKRVGYEVSSKRLPRMSRNPADYKNVFVGAIIAVAPLVVLTQLGLDTSLSGSTAQDSIWFPLLIGGLAGISTCMALVGGLVAGLGAKHASEHPDATVMQKFEPHLLFNVGRVFGFMILGGMLGWLGATLSPSPTTLGVLTILAAIFMLVVGLQLTGIFPRLSAFTLPANISRKLGLDHMRKDSYSRGGAAGLGVLSFFLPCGFTQAMQLTAAASGSWADGALMMGLFALGTTPGLLLIGGTTSLIKGRKSTAMLGIVGAVIVVLAVGNAVTGARAMGLDLNLSPQQIFTSGQATDSSTLEATYIGSLDFDKSEIHIKTGRDYRLLIRSQQTEYGCMSTIMLPSLSKDRPQLLKAGKTIAISLRADSPGSTKLVCAMGVPFNLTIIAEA